MGRTKETTTLLEPNPTVYDALCKEAVALGYTYESGPPCAVADLYDDQGHSPFGDDIAVFLQGAPHTDIESGYHITAFSEDDDKNEIIISVVATGRGFIAHVAKQGDDRPIRQNILFQTPWELTKAVAQAESGWLR